MVNPHHITCRAARAMAIWAVGVGCMVAVPSAVHAQSRFWLQLDGEASHLGSISNPVIIGRAGRTTPVYLWISTSDTTHGFDGISLDVRLLSSDGGSAMAVMAIDNPPGRWTGVTGGVARDDSGGQGVDDCNAFDFTNTDTLGPGPVRFARIDLTGVARGTVQLFLCVGNFGVADGGQNAVLWLGFQKKQTLPEMLNVSGGVSGQCSLIPEATIQVVPRMGDFDNDGDVDQSDFGRFQACFTAPFVAQTDPECDEALLDGDSDVDQDDYAIFQACMSGADVPASPDCVD
jgi:hypothetical protein